jgi:2-C-methyl-D-erythritol 2,4-cyclodiphosphate synthase
VNADLTVLAEAPRLAGFRIQMCQNIADDLGVRVARVNIKATTTESLGTVGRREGLACQAVVLLAHADDPQHGNQGTRQ